MRPPFPPELIDNIIDFLHDDPETLRECSTVSSTWVAASRYHLFSRVTIHHYQNFLDSFETNCQRLHRVVEASPQIAQYIKHLVIHNGPPRGGNEDQGLPLLLRALPSLQSLEVNPGQFVRSSAIWSEELLGAVAFAVSLKSFHKLRIHASTFNHPVSILQMLRSCHELKVLHLTNIGFLPWTQNSLSGSIMAQMSAEDFQESERGRIQVLSLDHPVIAGYLLHPLSPIDVSDIRDLTLKIYGEFSGADAKLLSSAPLMERLEITLMTDIGEDGQLDLSGNPELKLLIVEVPVLLDRFDPLPWLFALFSSIPTINSLQEIALTATIDLPPPQLTLPVYQDSLDGWKNLDSLLVDPKFSALRRIRLDFALDNPIEDQIVPTIIDDILSQFQELDNMGILYVDTCEIR